MSLISIAESLRNRIRGLSFSIPYVYNPLEYAAESFREYLIRYGTPPKSVLLVGMNPGPYGMAQTGVPFGDVIMVRDWLRIHAFVNKPEREHVRKPVLGFSCKRREVSGMRLWGWASKTFGRPEIFFRHFFVWNYCPLCFLSETGSNVTPDKLPRHEQAPLFAHCDQALQDIVKLLQVHYVLGIGVFAEQRIRKVAGSLDCVKIGKIPHPSPANPQANFAWEEKVMEELERLGIRIPDSY